MNFNGIITYEIREDLDDSAKNMVGCELMKGCPKISISGNSLDCERCGLIFDTFSTLDTTKEVSNWIKYQKNKDYENFIK